MKAFKKFLTESLVAGLRKTLSPCRRRGIMSGEPGMWMIEVLEIIVQYFLFHGRYGILGHGGMKARRHRQNRVRITRIVEIKIHIRNAAGKLFSLFRGFCCGNINTRALRKKLQAIAACYQRIGRWLNPVINRTGEKPFELLRHWPDKKIGIAAVPGGWSSNLLNKIFMRHDIILPQAESGLHRNNYLHIKNLLSQFFKAGSQPLIAYS